VNESWVKAHLEKLTSKIQNCKAVQLRISFEPTNPFYTWLSEGDENDLQLAGAEIAHFLDIVPPPVIHYDWGIKMEPEVAGRIKHSSHIIQIPFAYAGKRFALGGIIAHEMTHAFLFEREIILEDPQENEALTDLASIFIGLGKLILNGCITASPGLRELETLGYLPPDLLAFAYKEVCRQRSIRGKMMTAHLKAEAMELIRESG
jgi:hypothetical protein